MCNTEDNQTRTHTSVHPAQTANHPQIFSRPASSGVGVTFLVGRGKSPLFSAVGRRRTAVDGGERRRTAVGRRRTAGAAAYCHSCGPVSAAAQLLQLFALAVDRRRTPLRAIAATDAMAEPRSGAGHSSGTPAGRPLGRRRRRGARRDPGGVGSGVRWGMCAS